MRLLLEFAVKERVLLDESLVLALEVEDDLFGAFEELFVVPFEFAVLRLQILAEDL